MASIVTLGLSKIEVGDIAVDGGMGTTLASLGYTYQNTCNLTEEDPEETEHYAEEVDDPIVSIARRGKLTLNFSLMDPDATTLQKVFGGNVTLGKWDSPKVMPKIEQSIKVTPQQGLIIEIPRASIRAKLNSQFSKTGIFLVEIKATVLEPTKAATARISMSPIP